MPEPIKYNDDVSLLAKIFDDQRDQIYRDIIDNRYMTVSDSFGMLNAFTNTSPLQANTSAYKIDINLPTQINSGSSYYTTMLFNDSVEKKPSVTDKYPAGNGAYIRLGEHNGDIKQLLGRLLRFNPFATTGLDHFIQEIADIVNAGSLEVFAGKLRNVRAGKTDQGPASVGSLEHGHVYDPWFRDISITGPEHYRLVRFGRQMMNVAHDGATEFMCWVIETTIDGTKVKLFIFDEVKMAFVNTKRVTKHLTSISPYTVYTGESLDLLND